jgi:putative hydrolase of the HAD superfamily
LLVATRAVLFDLDETLFDHRYSVRTALARVQAGHPGLRQRALGELEEEYQRLLDALHPHVLAGAMTMEQARTERFRRLCEFCHAQISPDEAEGLAALYRAAYNGTRRPVAGAVPLLQALHGQVRVGVVSNNLTEEQREKLLVTGMSDLIDFLVTSEDAGAQKPDPAIFGEALSRAGCRATEAVMVGDSWESDVVGAVSVGMRAVWLNRRGVPCPDSTMAVEIGALEPVDRVYRLLLDGV